MVNEMKMNFFRRMVSVFPVGALLIGFSLSANAQTNTALEFGVLPYLPTATLLERYMPLRVYLERHLREPVSIVTAPDYAVFFERTQRREYPFVITASHAARLAELEGYQPMLRPGWDFYAVLLVKKDSAYQDIKDLRGKTIATPGPYAVVSQIGANWLLQAGLHPGQNVTLQSNPTHTSTMHAVVADAADAALISNRAFVAAKSDLKDRVRSLGQSKESGGPSVVYMAHPALPAKRVAAVKAAILAFLRTQEGKAFLVSLGYDTLREMKPGELAALDPYVRELKHLMATH